MANCQSFRAAKYALGNEELEPPYSTLEIESHESPSCSRHQPMSLTAPQRGLRKGKPKSTDVMAVPESKGFFRGLKRTQEEWEAKRNGAKPDNKEMYEQQASTTAEAFFGAGKHRENTSSKSAGGAMLANTQTIRAVKYESTNEELRRTTAMDAPEPTTGMAEIQAPEPPSFSRQQRVNLTAPQPGAYSEAPGECLQRRDNICFSLLGVGLDQVSLEEGPTEDAEQEGFNRGEPIIANALDGARLAEATPVEENIPDMEARPFHIDASGKTKLLEKRSYILQLGIMTILVIAVVATILGWVLKNSNKEAQPSHASAPTSYRSTLLAEFEAKIQKTFGDDYLHEENDLFEVRMLALYWILNEDPMQLESNADNLIQRYILTVFYFQTSKESDWVECGAGGQDLCYYKLWGGESTTPEYPWLSEHHECFWATIICDGNKTVEQIFMFDNGLSGSIPTELAGLAHLRDLYLPGNNLTGSIPTELSQLTTLEIIHFGRNQLGGEIDWMVFEPLHNLIQLRLNDNMFTGSISFDIEFFPGTWLELNRNDLTGSFPPEFYSLSNLIWWSGSGNRITGTIATDISRMVNLTHINLRNTLMSGSIPSEIGLLDNLDGIDVSSSNLGGSLPEELFTGVAPLIYIDVSNCAFSGTISTDIGLQTHLEWLSLANNNFEGNIPSEISALSKLARFRVNGNHFTGTFPTSVCTNFNQEYFSSSTKHFVADCLPDEDTSNIMMECQCCTECCNSNKGICVGV